MKRSNLMLALAACAALALIAAGCGGDDDDGSSGEALTQEEFIAQADEICAQGDEELTAAAQEQFGASQEPPPQEEQERFISEVVAPNFENQLAELRELNPPEADQEQIDELYAALESLIERARSEPAAVIDGEETEASRIAQQYGFTECGS